jgi:hypothetical protein
MDDRVFRELREKLGKAKNSFVKIGVLQESGSNAAEGGDISITELAAIHEFGAPKANIPARSFLKRTFTEQEGETALSKFLERIAKAIISERLEVRKALETLGTWAVGQVKARIKMGIPPPLRPATVKAKGSSTPLVDTGQLIGAISFEVKE